ncbi:hypothetical protein [Salegentibacter maritimus]|uniref:CD-NTase associated protein 4-like DNA endonuclease domain-containing protein n=1 Tax=Salegentibacter maritimus TaxID=2794347 RepID=A0ABS0TJT1_9FLAO|nr:hypothetical protein [Salegentibacter maritimus]MBI6121291.1 hypothetical protein [Salegentibacter maritimus]
MSISYKFTNTEINNKKAHDYETKSLLYLIGRRKDSKEIEYVTFDCFNDVSGVNKNSDKIWDIQSKNEKSLNPKKIGKYLFTLFDNFISSLEFKEFIFFSPPLNTNYKKDEKLNIYSVSNIESKTLERIRNGLKEEVKRVKGSKDIYSVEQTEFLKKVIFVEDIGLENEYVKTITKFKNVDLKTDAFYKSVFQDLRDIQSAKKNTYIENSEIVEIREVLNFHRHLYAKDIELLIISRIIGCEIFNYQSIPIYFSPLLDGYDLEDRRDIIQDCNSNLSRAFYNKNCNRLFWNLCEEIIKCLEKHESRDIEELFESIFPDYKMKISYLTL